jgi:SOS response regulatory protein OraA/RecX
MASDVLTLFNMPSSKEVARNYLDSQMVSPQQMGSQGLLQQVASLGGNAGTMLGYAGGRLFGGQAPQEARARGIEEAMAKVQGLGLQDDSEMYSALAQELGARGLSQDAMQAAQAARKVQAAQSQMTLEAARTAKENALAERALRDQPAKTQVVKANGRNLLIDSQTGEIVKDLGVAGKSMEDSLAALPGALATAMAGAQAKKAAEAGGTDVGKKIAEIQGKQTALEAVRGAQDIFNKGIYAGKYGPTMEALAGYTEGKVGSKERLANTETFRSYLGDVVIPGLKDFGGSDTVEELKYLQAVYAGDTTAQPKALKNMLTKAEDKISKNIKAIQEQQKAIQQGNPLPTEAVTQPKVRTWNRATGRFE